MAFSSRFDQISFAHLIARLHRRSGVLRVRGPLEADLEIQDGSIVKAFGASGRVSEAEMGQLLQGLLRLKLGSFTFYGDHILYDEDLLTRRLEAKTMVPSAVTQELPPQFSPDTLFARPKRRPQHLPAGESRVFWEEVYRLFDHQDGWSARELAKLTRQPEQRVLQHLTDLHAFQVIQTARPKESSRRSGRSWWNIFQLRLRLR
ncbi:MAG: hypothetical protein SFU83_01080 [Meiothermus sp.]|nr:hypothetical protein [Meiothermus sp.]